MSAMGWSGYRSRNGSGRVSGPLRFTAFVALLLGCLVLAPLTAHAQKASAGADGDVENQVTILYAADGRNPDGSRYGGFVTITRNGTKVTIDWLVGSTAYAGQGTISGNRIFATWGARNTPIEYVINPDGSLLGTWANGRGSERLWPTIRP